MPPIAKDEMRSKLSEISEMVDDALKEHLKDERLGNMVQILTYDQMTPGKRLRPALAYFIATSLHGDTKKTIHTATACELLHSASLMLDDAIDGDEMRRGNPTVNKAFGATTAMMGTYVLALLGLKIGIAKSSEIGTLLVNTLQSLVVGSNTELSWSGWDEETYLDIVRDKTAALFSAPCQIGSILSTENDKLRTLSRDYGYCAGIAYQLADDYVDIKKSIKLRMPVGDIKNQNTTIPIIYAYKYTKKAEIRMLLELYRKKVILPESHLRMIIDEIDELNACDYLEKLMAHYRDMAIKFAQSFPASDSRKYLEYLPVYMIDAMMEEIDMPDFNGD